MFEWVMKCFMGSERVCADVEALPSGPSPKQTISQSERGMKQLCCLYDIAAGSRPIGMQPEKQRDKRSKLRPESSTVYELILSLLNSESDQYSINHFILYVRNFYLSRRSLSFECLYVISCFQLVFSMLD